AIARGCSNALSQQRKEKEGISLHFLESLVRRATLHKLHLFKALIVLAYCFSCRVPSELLNESNRSLHIHENAVTLRLFRRKNTTKSTTMCRRCTCHILGASLCPVEATKSLITLPIRSMSLSTFNNLLRLCATRAGFGQRYQLLSSHAFRRGFITDMAIAGFSDQNIDKAGGWASSKTKSVYILQHH
ncbi:hypothetical protein FOZ63_012736, partial [Perkinsus olseni]